MASRSDIEAGKAHVTLYTKNSLFTQGIKAAQQTVQQLARGLSQLGSSTLRIGAAFSAPFLAAVTQLDEARDLVKGIKDDLAEALGRPLLPVLQFVRQVVGSFKDWAAKNQAIIQTVAKVAVGMLVAGAAIKLVAALLLGVSGALKLSMLAMTGLSIAMAVLTNPIGLIVVGLLAGVVAWARFTDSGRAAIATIMETLAPLGETIRTAFGGIVDALLAGDLTLAGQIAMRGLELIFLQSLDIIADMIGSVLGGALLQIGSQLIQGDFTAAWQSAIDLMGTVWDGFSAGVLAVFTEVINKVRELWDSTIAGIRTGLMALTAILSAYGGRAGQTAATALNAASSGLGAIGGAGSAALGLVGSAAARARDAAAGRSIAGQTAFSVNRLRGREEIEGRERELEELRKKAAEARAAANTAVMSGAKGAVSVGFSAAGLISQLGGGGGPQDRIARAAEVANKKHDEQIALLRDIKNKGGMMAWSK